MKIKVLNIDGTSKNDINLSEKIFAQKVNKTLIQSIVNYQIQKGK